MMKKPLLCALGFHNYAYGGHVVDGRVFQTAETETSIFVVAETKAECWNCGHPRWFRDIGRWVAKKLFPPVPRRGE